MKEEQKYYEMEDFWNSKNVKEEEIQRIKETYNLIPKDVRSIADIGCGNGIFSNYVIKKDKRMTIVGVDNSEKALSYVKTRKIKEDIEFLPFKDREYDLSVALEVIEHLSYDNYESVLEEIARVSQKYIIISVPYREKLKKNFIECPQCGASFSASFHKRSFNEDSMKSLFEKHNFKCEEIKYIGIDKNYIIISSLYNYIKRFFFKKHIKRVFVCPVCSFSNKESQNTQKILYKEDVRRKEWVKWIKLFWPSIRRYKWIVGVYKRNS